MMLHTPRFPCWAVVALVVLAAATVRAQDRAAAGGGTAGRGTAGGGTAGGGTADNGTAAPVVPAAESRSVEEEAGAVAVTADVTRAKAEWVDPFIETVPSPLGREQASRVANALRAHLGRLDTWLAVEVTDFTARRKVRQEVHALLASGLSAAGGKELADELMTTAEVAYLEQRREYLRGHIICWCPDEGWTKSLAGCPDGCANEQKGLVDRWLDAGLSDQEVFDRMVAHPKGGPKVLGVPKDARDSRWFVLPFLFAVVCVVGFAALLRRIRSRSRVQAATFERAAAASGTKDDWDARIERELKEMDD